MGIQESDWQRFCAGKRKDIKDGKSLAEPDLSVSDKFHAEIGRHRTESPASVPVPVLEGRDTRTGKKHDQTRNSVPHPKPQSNQAAALERTDAGKEAGICRTRVRFTGYRVRPLDPDNFAGSVKDLLDGLRHAGLISGDEPWKIILETEQVKVGSFKEEKTVVEIG